jgi:hypothetical protein
MHNVTTCDVDTSDQCCGKRSEPMWDISKKKINGCNLQQWAFWIMMHIQSWFKIVNLKRNYKGS